ncbi:MAG: hypothetical protein E6R03_01080 [Hyphomicrobiaceae bacterium]|nr:MAG: hypothetical protein E6R03_01080 [Hyphomicrobiaceae bacterium]
MDISPIERVIHDVLCKHVERQGFKPLINEGTARYYTHRDGRAVKVYFDNTGKARADDFKKIAHLN